MSIFVPCGWKANADKFATSKSNGQVFLHGSLLADTIWDIFVLATGNVVTSDEVWMALWIIDMTSLVIECLGVTMALILAFYSPKKIRVVPKDGGELGLKEEDDDDPNLKEAGKASRPIRHLNDTLTMLTIILFIVIAIKNVIKSRAFFQESCILPEGVETTT